MAANCRVPSRTNDKRENSLENTAANVFFKETSKRVSDNPTDPLKIAAKLRLLKLTFLKTYKLSFKWANRC